MVRKEQDLSPKSHEDVDCPTKDDLEIFISAARSGDINTIETFLAKWPRAVNEKDSHTWTALMHAAWLGHETIVETLIKYGADVREKDKWGRATWALVRRKGNREIIILIEEALKKK